MNRLSNFWIAASCAALIGSGCSTSSMTPHVSIGARTTAMQVSPNGRAQRRSSGPIQHIIVMVQENRSFDNLFATYPGADGATTGMTHTGKIIPLKEQPLAALDINHLRKDYLNDCDMQSTGTCKMDGFDLSHIGQAKAGRYAYQYVNPAQIGPYWSIANQYVLADHMFQTQGSGSFTAHQDLIAGATVIDPYDSLVDTPSSNLYWGCDAQPSTTTSLLTTTGQYIANGGPFPCLTYPTGTLRDLLDAANVQWKYYTPRHRGGTTGALWNAFDAIKAVRYGPEWTGRISMPETTIFSDITNGELPEMAWVVPRQQNSDHPHKLNGIYTGPQWVASVVNAIGNSPYWDSTAIVIVWDDWGGFYDNVPPAFFDDAGGLGFRVPMLIVSPYVPDGQVDHTQYEFGSILKFIEQTFNLGSLGTTDARATSIGRDFNFTLPPRPFTTITSSHSKAYFLHQGEDNEPVDSE